MAKYGTKNFSLSSDPKLQCTCGTVHCDKRKVSQSTLNKLQKMRDDLKSPMQINSGARCPNHPNEIGRGLDTDHQDCTTVDIKCLSAEQATKITGIACRHGATRVSTWVTGDSFVHVSFRRTSRRDIPTWTYSKDKSRERAIEYGEKPEKQEKSVTKSKTMAAGAVGVTSVCATAPVIVEQLDSITHQLSPVAESVPVIKLVIAGVSIVTVGVMAFMMWERHKKLKVGI